VAKQNTVENNPVDVPMFINKDNTPAEKNDNKPKGSNK
jgi:hypothetical protein